MTGGQFLATTRCSSTSSSSSELLGEKPGLLATPPIKQNGSVYLGRFLYSNSYDVAKIMRRPTCCMQHERLRA
ncbi:hypothetical protein HMPREF1492_0859 [Atopobium sp. BS2]|nr:hypothetical protein HMPREF1492_0859 [Atopobium sp. BS2]